REEIDMMVRRLAGTCLALGLSVAGLAAPTRAQQPTPEQISAIRASCRSDFMSRCSGVTPGGAEALACLRNHVAQLSPPCQTAVSATMPKTQASPAPAEATQAAAPPPASA